MTLTKQFWAHNTEDSASPGTAGFDALYEDLLANQPEPVEPAQVESETEALDPETPEVDEPPDNEPPAKPEIVPNTGLTVEQMQALLQDPESLRRLADANEAMTGKKTEPETPEPQGQSWEAYTADLEKNLPDLTLYGLLGEDVAKALEVENQSFNEAVDARAEAKAAKVIAPVISAMNELIAVVNAQAPVVHTVKASAETVETQNQLLKDVGAVFPDVLESDEARQAFNADFNKALSEIPAELVTKKNYAIIKTLAQSVASKLKGTYGAKSSNATDGQKPGGNATAPRYATPATPPQPRVGDGTPSSSIDLSNPKAHSYDQIWAALEAKKSKVQGY